VCRLIQTEGYYVNGVGNTPIDAQHAASSLTAITGYPVTALYNATSSPDRIVQTVTTAAQCGVFAPLYLMNRYGQIQDQKGWYAFKLANLVARRLSQHPNQAVALFGHSQGAHIVARAYQMLHPSLQQRVRPLTFGGMVEAERGKNFHHRRDVVAQGARLWTGSATRGTPIDSRVCVTRFCHGTADYFKDAHVAAAARKAMLPTLEKCRFSY